MKNNTKNFSKLVKEIGQVSAQCLTPKQVIDDLIQLSCNLLTEDEFLAKAFPRAFFRQSAVIRQEMHQYKNDPKAWALMSELIFEYMKLIKESGIHVSAGIIQAWRAIIFTNSSAGTAGEYRNPCT